ncbi:hypothetical protein HMPREF9093_02026 [Fusobacterium sp. oral taxon 370 str. F0437]|nr:hypothetical protein [Fusobacterium sp. oral taxon 370]EHI76698.1 hypothetical protein HMPREF9093_02026 [Fusobacterium sp. oral taxon 370 str. F0437]
MYESFSCSSILQSKVFLAFVMVTGLLFSISVTVTKNAARSSSVSTHSNH